MAETLDKKIDFAVVFSVKKANPNGDPLGGNVPRTDLDGMGEVSDVCIKRKIRNRLQDAGERIFVQSADRSDDGCRSLEERKKSCNAFEEASKAKDEEAMRMAACSEWIDVRSFGQVFAFKGDKLSMGVRGAVSVQAAESVEPIITTSMQITKSVNSTTSDIRTSDTMGTKHRVDFGVYRFFGSINVQIAERNGFTYEDALKIKDALLTLFENDCSSARPEGSMVVEKLYWWEHNCKSGQYSSATVHRTLNIIPKTATCKSIDDYEISVKQLEGLKCEEYDGI